MTFTQHDRLDKLITDNYTTKELKTIIKILDVEVVGTNPLSYTPLKSDYVSAIVGNLFITLDDTTPTGLTYHPNYIVNTILLSRIKALLLKEKV